MYVAFRRRKGVVLSAFQKVVQSVIVADYYLKNQLLSFLQKNLFNLLPATGVKKILILRSGGMGDTVTALPAFSAIKKKYPDAVIDLLTNQPRKGKNAPAEILPEGYINQYYYYKLFVDKDIQREIKTNKYDLFIELPTYNSSLLFELRSMAFAWKTGIKSAIGWHQSSTRFLQQYQKAIFEFDTNQTRLLKILSSYGLPERDMSYLLEENGVKIPIDEVQDILNLLPDHKTIAIVPGAGRPQNKWPLHHFEKVIRHFTQIGYTICLIGGEADFKDGESLRHSQMVVNLCGKLTLLQNAAVFKRCQLAITNDTGPMHVAYAAGIPVVAMFSARDYRGKWYPPDDGRNIVLRCEKEMDEILPETVISAATTILSAG